MLTAKMVKDCAVKGGADICGIASIERFKDGPPETHPARAPLGKGRQPPCIMLHMRVAAALAGLGEPGWSKVFLTPEFGPRQRFDILLTDAELEPDPLLKEPICDKCQAC